MFEDANVLLCSMCARASAQRECVGGGRSLQEGTIPRSGRGGGCRGGDFLEQFLDNFCDCMGVLAPQAGFLVNVDHFIAF